MMDTLRITVQDRNELIEHITKYAILEEDTGCWRWNGAYSDTGYGQWWFRGRSHGAHRISFLARNLMLDKSLQVHHSCGNRWCIRFEHLTQGDHSKNGRESVEQGTHYNASRLSNVPVPTGMKICNMCMEIKSRGDFYKRTYKTAAPDGLQSRCKACQKRINKRRTQ